MKYMFLIYGSQAERAIADANIQDEMAAYNAFEAAASKVMVGGHALHTIDTATTVRVRDNKTLTTDGPFAETKEQLGGYYILDCKDLDEAIAMAALIPSAKQGTIEIRPIVIFG